MRIEHYQPRLIPPPLFQPQLQEEHSIRGREWVAGSKSFASRASSRGSFSVRRKLNAYNGVRRPHIGSPSDFRHLDNDPPRRAAPGAERFRPLELSIYMPENQLSPILPHFGNIDDMSIPSRYSKELPFPPAVLTHSRSESSMSFRIPRKPVRSGSGTSSEWTAHFQPRPGSLSAQELMAALEKELPKAPQPARLRAKTEPPSYERVKCALDERDELEKRLKDIEETIEERKSIYLSSRPTSRASVRPASIYSESQGMVNLRFKSFMGLHYSRANAKPCSVIQFKTCVSFLCATSFFSSWAAAKDSSLKNRTHPFTPGAVHRSIGHFHHTFTVICIYIFQARPIPPSSSPSACPSTTSTPSEEEEIFLPGLKLAVSLGW